MESNPRRVLVPYGVGRAYAPGGSGVLLYGRGCITYNEAVDQANSGGSNITLFDGTSSNGQQIIDYTLTENESTSEMWGMHWVQFTEGLYLVTNSGSVSGSLSAWVDHDCSAYNGALYHMAKLAQMELELRVAALGGYAIPNGATS